MKTLRKLSTKLQGTSLGFTLIELVIVVAVLSIVVTVAIIYPAYSQSKKDAAAAADAATAKTLNDGIIRARDLKGDTNSAISTNSTNQASALRYLINTGYISQQ
jgi:prepilin-type N-terminal cleavage/methylation domain-containing protein